MQRGISVKKHSYRQLAVILIITGMLLSNIIYAPGAKASATEDDELRYLKSVMDMIKEKYNGEVTDKQLIEGALKGMFGSMDPYTAYFTSEQADSFFNDLNGAYEGIGISMEQKGDYIVVIKAFSSSPAEKAGILPGDRIVSADGKNLISASTEEAASMIMGKSGTKVSLGILRSNGDEVIIIEVTRAQITINPVTYEIKDGVGYIRLDVFNSNAYEFMIKALEEMDRSSITKIILDLRNNPGGEVGQAVSIARMFVPQGLITRLDFKSESVEDEEYFSYLENPKYKLAVLVNGMSASASEILAGAVQDTDAGTLIGAKTFGKAKVQNILPILTPEAYIKYESQLGIRQVDAYDLISKYGISPADSEIIGWTKITTGIYTTPKGRMIDGIGLTPEIQIGDPDIINGIDAGSIQKLSITSKPTLDSVGMDVYNAEKILKIIGYDVDSADTILDMKTFNAVWKFRVDRGLYPGGVLDFSTQKALNSELDLKILEIDRQYAKAVEVLNSK